MNNLVQTDNTPEPLINTLATVSFVLGLISGSLMVFSLAVLHKVVLPNATDSISWLFHLMLVVTPMYIIVGVVTLVTIGVGHLAHYQTKKSLRPQIGDSLAVVGLIIGYVNVILICLVLFWMLVLYGQYQG